MASAIKTVGDLQPVVEGSCAELYGLIIKVMASVGCPSWPNRLGESGENLARFSVSLFCFDAGGECQLHLRRVQRDFAVVARCETVAHCWLFCVHHQGPSIVKSLWKVLDNFSWRYDDRLELPTHYFTGVASTSNAWRSIGPPARIKDTAVPLFCDEVASQCFSHGLADA